MRLLLRNAALLLVFALVLRLCLFLHTRGDLSSVTLLFVGLAIGCAAAIGVFYLFRRRVGRGAREMSYSEAKALSQQILITQERKNTAHADLLWWFTFE